MVKPAGGDNAEQIDFWNGEAGKRWADEQDSLDAMLHPLGLGAIERADLMAGDRVIDVGCGCGVSTLAIAHIVGPTGHVLGVDVSEPMLQVAKQRGKGHGNLSFTRADASTYKFAPATADLIFSQFGVMFFSDPQAAFKNIRKALKPDGRVCMVVWRPAKENPWVMRCLKIAAEHGPLPAPMGPDAPGPFAFGDVEKVEGILEGAGFSDVHMEPQDMKMHIGAGRDLNGAVDFLLGIGPMRMLLEEHEPKLREKIRAQIVAALTPDFTPQGLLMDSATWIVTAKNG